MLYPEPGPGTSLTPPGQDVAPVPRRPQYWGGWATIGLGFVVVVVYSLIQSGVGIFFVFARTAQNPELDIFQAINDLISNGLFISVATMVSAAVGTGLVILFISLRKGASLKQYLNLRPLSRGSILLMVAVLAGLLLISLVVGLFYSQTSDSGFTLDALKSVPSPVLLGVAVLIFAPLFEEFLFRGFLFKGLRNSAAGPGGAVVLTALFWAGLHLQYDAAGLAEIFVLGLAFGLVRLKTDSLYSTLTLHFLWNLAALISAALALQT
jgi:membrane protease YdiL (CAAX protease family)